MECRKYLGVDDKDRIVLTMTPEEYEDLQYIVGSALGYADAANDRDLALKALNFSDGEEGAAHNRYLEAVRHVVNNAKTQGWDRTLRPETSRRIFLSRRKAPEQEPQP